MSRFACSLLTVVKCVLVHAALTAAVWLGPLTCTTFGLGFKDKDQWTLIDHVISATALPLNLLTTPGQYVTWMARRLGSGVDHKLNLRRFFRRNLWGSKTHVAAPMVVNTSEKRAVHLLLGRYGSNVVSAGRPQPAESGLPTSK